jgi:hypothetical protein
VVGIDALGDAAQPTPPGSDPFSLGDAATITGILEGAGFAEIQLQDVHEPVLYGPDLEAALAIVLGFQSTRAALATLSDAESACTLARLRELLAAHHSAEYGVRLDSRSWLVTARAQAAALAHGRGLVAAPADAADGS